jgi:GT2 family glycosyltransferase
MDLSIIIVSYNTKEFLKECLQSIFSVPTNVKFEIIVVDNNSRDGSPEMVRADFPNVNLVVLDENLGFSKANNKGISISKGRYVLLLNGDTVVLPGTFDRFIHFADEHPDGAIFGCTHLDRERNVTYSFAYGFIAPRIAKSKKPLIISKGYVSGACMLIRRDFGEKFGWLDEQFFFCPEDIEICWRAVKNGRRVYFTSDAEIIHYGAKSCGSGFNPLVYYEAKRGYGIMINKHGNGFQKKAGRLLMKVQITGDLLSARISKDKIKEDLCREVRQMYLTQDYSVLYLELQKSLSGNK